MKRWLPTLLILALPAAASAVELNFALDGSSKYDDNVFRNEKSSHKIPDVGHKTDGVAVAIQPHMIMAQNFQSGRASLRYSPVLEHYFLSQTNKLDDNHFGAFDLSYALGPRTQLTAEDRIESTLNHRFQFERVQDAPDTGQIEDDVQGRNTLNEATLSLEHYFTRRLFAEASAYHQLFLTEDPGQIDSRVIGEDWSLNYQMSRQHAFGVGSSFSAEFFERFKHFGIPGHPVLEPSSRTLVAQVTAIWRWQLTSDTLLSANVGPAWLETRQEGCQCLGGAQTVSSDARITIFAAVTLAQRLGDNFTGRLSYSRNTSTASGTGGSSVRDSVTGSLFWRISELWSMTGLASWSLRKSATGLDERTSGRDINSTYWEVGMRGARQITRRLAATVGAQYRRQVDLNGDEDFGNFIATAGLSYAFDRIPVFE